MSAWRLTLVVLCMCGSSAEAAGPLATISPGTIEESLALSIPDAASPSETLADASAHAETTVLNVTPIRTLRGSLVQLSCDLPSGAMPQRAVFKVFDEAGALVRVVADETVTSATFLAWWDCTDSERNRLPAGTYVVELSSGLTRAQSTLTVHEEQ